MLPFGRGLEAKLKVAITGAAGRQILATIYDLIENDDVEAILLIDLSEDALKKREALVSSNKIKTQVCDITNIDRLAELLKPYDVVVNGSSHIFNLDVMEACLASKTNYTDLGGLFHWALKQLKRHDDFKAAGITGIVGSGSAPGIVNVFAKYGADRLDTVDTVLILDAIINPNAGGYKFTPPYALNTIVEEFTANNFEFINGKMEELPPFSGKITVDFHEPYGTLNLFNMIHSEVATMPLSFKDKGIQNVAFKLALPAIFEERLRFLIENGLASKEPINVKGTQIVPRDVLMELFEVKPGEQRVASTAPSDKKLLRVLIKGTKDGKKLTYVIETDLGLYPWGMANNAFTVGFPAAVTARMLGNNQIPKKGFFSGESVIDPEIYFYELARRDIEVKIEVFEGWISP